MSKRLSVRLVSVQWEANYLRPLDVCWINLPLDGGTFHHRIVLPLLSLFHAALYRQQGAFCPSIWRTLFFALLCHRPPLPPHPPLIAYPTNAANLVLAWLLMSLMSMTLSLLAVHLSWVATQFRLCECHTVPVCNFLISVIHISRVL